MKPERKKLFFSLLWELLFLVFTAWTFFDFSLLSAGLVLYVPFSVKKCIRKWKEQMKYELNLAFKDALISMENCMAVGYSSESALKEAEKDLIQLYGEEHRLCTEFGRMSKQLELGRSIEEAFREFAERSAVEDIRLLAELLSVTKRTGGNVTQVFRQTQGILQEKIELGREIQTVIAAKKLEFQIMCMVPYGILLYLKLCAPAMVCSLYETVPGVLFMCVAFFWYLAMSTLGERMIGRELNGKEIVRNEKKQRRNH